MSLKIFALSPFNPLECQHTSVVIFHRVVTTMQYADAYHEMLNVKSKANEECLKPAFLLTANMG